MDTTAQTLTPKQQKVISVVLMNRNISEGIEKAGVSRTTFYDWMKEPLFKSEFDRQRNEVIESGLHDLKMSFSAATNTLMKLLASSNENIQLKAAIEVIGHVQKLVEHESLERRIIILENENKRN